jgi:hypothetical protein
MILAAPHIWIPRRPRLVLPPLALFANHLLRTPRDIVAGSPLGHLGRTGSGHLSLCPQSCGFCSDMITNTARVVVAGWSACGTPPPMGDLNGTWDLAINSPHTCQWFLTTTAIKWSNGTGGANLFVSIFDIGGGQSAVAFDASVFGGGTATLFTGEDDAATARTCAVSVNNSLTACPPPGTNQGKNGTATISFI